MKSGNDIVNYFLQKSIVEHLESFLKNFYYQYAYF